jgi:hypothetical protein
MSLLLAVRIVDVECTIEHTVTEVGSLMGMCMDVPCRHHQHVCLFVGMLVVNCSFVKSHNKPLNIAAGW